jgi:hypothetical protein
LIDSESGQSDCEDFDRGDLDCPDCGDGDLNVEKSEKFDEYDLTATLGVELTAQVKTLRLNCPQLSTITLFTDFGRLDDFGDCRQQDIAQAIGKTQLRRGYHPLPAKEGC